MHTFSAKSIAPSPPFSQFSSKLKSTISFNSSFSISISSLVSFVNLFIATIGFNPNDFIVENELYHEYLDFYSNLFGKELESFESQKVEEIEDKTIKEEKTIEEHKPIDIQFKQKMTLNIDGENKEYFLLDATSYQENIEKIKDYVTKLEEQLAIIKTLF